MKQEFKFTAKSVRDVFEEKHELKHIDLNGEGATSSLMNIIIFLDLDRRIKISKASCESDIGDISFTVESCNEISFEDFKCAVKRFQDHILLRRHSDKNVNAGLVNHRSNTTSGNKEFHSDKNLQQKLARKRFTQHMSVVGLFTAIFSVFFKIQQ